MLFLYIGFGYYVLSWFFVFGELCVLGVALLLYLLGLVWCHSFGAVMLFPILC